MKDPISIEEIVQRIVALAEKEDDNKWDLGALLYVAKHKHKLSTGYLAYQLRCSAQWINKLSRTFQVFPDESDRCPELTWSHHEVATKADDPKETLDVVVRERMSVKELKDFLCESPRKKPAVQAWERVIKYLESDDPDKEWFLERIRTIAWGEMDERGKEKGNDRSPERGSAES